MAPQIVFPDPNKAEDDGFIAVGGNLSVEFLLAAYSQGVFPWFNRGGPILWWSPNPRMLLFPEKFKCSRSLLQTIRNKKFEVRADDNFHQIISYCANTKREGQQDTWITPEMIDAYIRLHAEGYAHSIETYKNGELVGGLYGVSIGRAFFGESMFHVATDASKIALFYLIEKLRNWQFHFIDVQQSTAHLKSMGAEDITRREFLERLNHALTYETKIGKWNLTD